ncbi:MAG: hypothetical protein KatS3mg105_1860 [Gemmatales bacterium]|nr:MAG: hypothetical protein KatS3mg105_1860 [Gemmatales bacterium]
MNLRKWCLVGAVCLLACTGCQRQRPLRIGAKEFTEQVILAEMAAQLLRANGFDVEPIVFCQDTFECQRRLRDGEIDLMVEYSGTGLLFLHEPLVSSETTLARARKLYEPLDLHWLEPLGFDNHYQVLMTVERANSLGIESIADLKKIPGGVRIACPSAYVRRPRDGLTALCERYGLKLARRPLLIDSPLDRADTLYEGRADAIVAFATDGGLSEFDLKMLEDNLRFFPSYEAAFLVRGETIRQQPKVETLLNQLENRFDLKTMQRLNLAVEVRQARAPQVARQFLLENNLLPATAEEKIPRVEILVAAATDDQALLHSFAIPALRAVSAAFPQDSASIEFVADPVASLSDGSARLAMIGSERFFIPRGQRPPRRLTHIEALAVVGNREIHVIRRADDLRSSDPFAGRVGVPPAGSGANQVAVAMLEGKEVVIEAAAGELIKHVIRGNIDVAIILAKPGEKVLGLDELEVSKQISLCPLKDWLTLERRLRLPYLRPATISARTYPGQDEAVETLGTQVLLAGAAQSSASIATGAGPASALPMGGKPLQPEQISALASAALDEAPDPVLPSSWTSRSRSAANRDTFAESALKTGLNMLIIAFLAWLVVQVRQPRSENFAEP